MAKDCCWNCKHYIVRGDNEPAVLSNSVSNVCVFNGNGENNLADWEERAVPMPPNSVCKNYIERFY